MNGASAEPSVNTIMVASNIKNMTIGANHHFFRIFKNSQNSLTIDILLIILFILNTINQITRG